MADTDQTERNNLAPGRSLSLARVLVPLDGSEAAAQVLPYAAEIAKSGSGGAIVLLEVTPPADNVRNILGREIAPATQVQEGYTKVATGQLEAAAAALPAGVEHKTVVATGDPAAEILRVAGEERVDLIAMTTSGAGAWGPFAFGQVVDRVVRADSRPVLVVPPRPQSGGGWSSPPSPETERVTLARILVPIDGSEAAFAALSVAAVLADAFGVEIRVVQAVSYDREAAIPSEIAHPDVIEREFRGASRSVAEAAVADAVARLQRLGVSARGDVLTGNPVVTVISEAGRDDLVVLTSRGQGKHLGDATTNADPAAATPGVSWTLGGVADKLLRSGTSPVVLVPA
jgi:nucleotide-binding universal stress UspA family protein